MPDDPYANARRRWFQNIGARADHNAKMEKKHGKKQKHKKDKGKKGKGGKGK